MSTFGLKVHNQAPFEDQPPSTRDGNQMATYIHGLDNWVE